MQLFDLIPGIELARLTTGVEDEGGELIEDAEPSGQKAPPGSTTRVQDPERRAAVEQHAVAAALEYYEKALGATDWEVLGKPYDIKVMVDGVERHCEVKGSSMIIDTVELTINEVNHGLDCAHSDLIVVDGIEVTKDQSTGQFHTAGGRRRVWTDWTPAEEALEARRFAYLLPDE
ncbi:protein NO VEIN domain-containing protein [Blastococcus brunescens]|uniref:DUF3883 domain-containing protein n=1 Tax=Blastococcus brunescens TaxID=1564165 RepID=A0ABZ1B3Y8_9ACTN|nr:DUF3883 domain-containing protein [Blastococcus sp. BMG 8361]WRL65512.1 DUF3883 domain-containing protein [Blastococcus sp. BMG 8361]